jgi:hypothetical protein
LEVALTTYVGNEEGIELHLRSAPETDSVFDLRPPDLPQKAVPVFDDELGAVVGYRYGGSVQTFYDLDGKVVGMEEPGLESPWLDPIDLIFFAGGIFRAIGKGVVTGAVRTAPKVAATAAVRLSARMLAVSVLGAMRTTFRGLSVRTLKFTATTAARMTTQGRYVPIHILHLAIKHGSRVADPQGVKGVFLYTARLLKNGKPYSLEVVVRESDWTILHFLYK